MTKTAQNIHSNRPLSPHLSIYRPQISSTLSIFHRVSGSALFFGLMVIAWGIIFATFSDCSPFIASFAQTIFFKLFLIALSFAGFFHLSTGVRHLFWDMGMGFSIKVMNTTGWLAITSSILMTIIFWILIYV